jgi:hypothetical protein
MASKQSAQRLQLLDKRCSSEFVASDKLPAIPNIRSVVSRHKGMAAVVVVVVVRALGVGCGEEGGKKKKTDVTGSGGSYDV